MRILLKLEHESGLQVRESRLVEIVLYRKYGQPAAAASKICKTFSKRSVIFFQGFSEPRHSHSNASHSNYPFCFWLKMASASDTKLIVNVLRVNHILELRY